MATDLTSTTPGATPGATSPSDPRQLYLDLLKKTLTYSLWPDSGAYAVAGQGGVIKRRVVEALQKRGLRLVRDRAPDLALREEGKDWPAMAHTMVGFKRLNNVQACVEDVIRNGVPGDLIETGVWRGGTVIFMRAILKAYGVTDRTVWVADSFEGLPPPDAEKYAADAGDQHHTYTALAVSQEAVEANFRSFGLLDGQVRFLKGWFKDTLHVAPLGKLAVARLDGDMYESTMDAIKVLYPKLSVGGYLIVDDYALPPCKAAVEDYRKEHGITEPIQTVDWSGVYWKRER